MDCHQVNSEWHMRDLDCHYTDLERPFGELKTATWIQYFRYCSMSGLVQVSFWELLFKSAKNGNSTTSQYTLTVLSVMSQEVAPKWMIGAANGHWAANTCTWAITSCLVSFSSWLAFTKSTFSKFSLNCLICSSVMGKPNFWKIINLRIMSKRFWNR